MYVIGVKCWAFGGCHRKHSWAQITVILKTAHGRGCHVCGCCMVYCMQQQREPHRMLSISLSCRKKSRRPHPQTHKLCHIALITPTHRSLIIGAWFKALSVPQVSRCKLSLWFGLDVRSQLLRTADGRNLVQLRFNFFSLIFCSSCIKNMFV